MENEETPDPGFDDEATPDEMTDADPTDELTDAEPLPSAREVFGDELDDDAVDELDDDAADDAAVGAPLPPQPEIATGSGPMPPPVPDQGLVRDPYARLGGIASGIAHRYGWDVAITRLVFLVALFLSGGTLIPVYLIAWLVIPRATYWPPVAVRQRRGGLTMREVGIGLAAAGALLFLAVGTGSAGSVLVPLLLIGGGMFLLFQSPRDELAVAPAGVSAHAAPPAPAAAYVGSPPPPVVPMPVQPRSRGRRLLGFLAAGVLLFVLLAVIAIPLLLIAFIADADIDVDEQRRFRPTSAAEFPFRSDSDAGSIVIDLSDLSSEDFDGQEEPAVIDVELGAGEVILIVPDGLAADIDAEVTVGELTVFGDNESGFASDLIVDADDEVLDIRIDVFAGDVDVVRDTDSVSAVIREAG